jgi:hypothetical protein
VPGQCQKSTTVKPAHRPSLLVTWFARLPIDRRYRRTGLRRYIGMGRILQALVFALPMMLGVLPSATGGAEAGAPLQVRAAVIARTDIQTRAPSLLLVRESGLARGAKLPPQPLQLRAFSNASSGLEVDLQAPVGMFTQLRVQGAGIDAVLPGEGGSFVWRWAQRPGFTTPATLDLRVTFTLDESLPAGSHVWPLLVTGRALTQ